MKYLVKECRPLNSSELEMVKSFEDHNGVATFILKDGGEFIMHYLGAPYPTNLSECRIVYLDNLSDEPFILRLAGRDIEIDTVLELHDEVVVF